MLIFSKRCLVWVGFFSLYAAIVGIQWNFFSRKSAPDEVDEPAVRSERVSLLWHLMGDLFQQGPQTVDLRVPLCRIMQGQRVRSHAGSLSLLVKKQLSSPSRHLK